MFRNLAGKYTLITIKMLLILLMLNLSTVFIFGQTSAAVDAFTEYASESNDGSSLENGGGTNISAGIDPMPTTTSKPVKANVIVLPKEVGSLDDDKDSNNEEGTNEEGTTPNGGNNMNPDLVQGEPNKAEGTVGATDAKAGFDQQNSTDIHHDKPEQDTGDSSGEIPAAGQASGTKSTATLVQTELDKVYRHEGEKVAYLTFDDGPIPSMTSAILDILKEENVKATFFLIGSNAERYPEIVRRQYEEGHGIGNHTYSHVFKHIYNNTENYIDELTRSEQVLKSILGDEKEFKLTRFPGGSFGKALAPFRQAVNEAGYLYVDWNSLNGDAETSRIRPAKRLVERLKETVTGQSGLVVLMHDAPNKHTTIEALPEIIQFLRSENYRFELLPGSR